MAENFPTRPSDSLQTKRCKGPGQAGQTAQAEEEKGLQTRHLTSSYLRTKYRNHAEKNKRKCKREGREKKERNIRVLCMPQQQMPPQRGDVVGKKIKRLPAHSLLTAQHRQSAPTLGWVSTTLTLWQS
jgi:hypothetical protein